MASDAASVEREKANRIDPRLADVISAADLFHRLIDAQAAPTFAEAHSRLGTALQQWSGCDRAILGVANRRGECQLLHVTDAPQIDHRSPSARAIQAALDETLSGEGILVWSSTAAPEALVFRQLAKLVPMEAAVGIPLRTDSGRPVGALILCGRQPWLDNAASQRRVVLGQRPVAMCLELLRHSLGSPLYRVQQAWHDLRQKQLLRVIATAVVVLLSFLAIPFPNRVRCDMALEPVTRRFVASPFDGTLAKANVEPGQVVREGDVLATLDERELRWQLTGLEAEYVAARKRRETALANHEAVSAQLATLEMEQLDTKIKTLRHRSDHLSIQSPIDGVVLSGDLKRTEGAPLTIGQALFEIAPLDKMIAEIEVPQDEVGRVKDGMSVALRFDAFPHTTWTGVIQKLHPRAELRQQHSSFIAEVVLENPQEQLRPGMKGRARISAAYRPLAWIYFHRPYDALVRRLGW